MTMVGIASLTRANHQALSDKVGYKWTTVVHAAAAMEKIDILEPNNFRSRRIQFSDSGHLDFCRI